MKECDKWKSHISSKLRMIHISSNTVRPAVTKTFTPLHYISPNYTSLHVTALVNTASHLNFTQLHFTTLSFDLTPFKFSTAPFHLTSLHFTSLHFTALLDDFCHTSIPFISPHLQLLSVPVFQRIFIFHLAFDANLCLHWKFLTCTWVISEFLCVVAAPCIASWDWTQNHVCGVSGTVATVTKVHCLCDLLCSCGSGKTTRSSSRMDVRTLVTVHVFFFFGWG